MNFFIMKIGNFWISLLGDVQLGDERTRRPCPQLTRYTSKLDNLNINQFKHSKDSKKQKLFKNRIILRKVREFKSSILENF